MSVPRALRTILTKQIIQRNYLKKWQQRFTLRVSYQVLHRVRGQIESGAYYEAQQSYKTVYHRYKAKGMIQESYKVLEEGSCLQLENGQVNCGTELGNMLIAAYDEDEVELSAERVSAFRRMVLLLPQPELSRPELNHNSAEVEEGSRFIDNVIRWLKKNDFEYVWYPEFNSFAGDYLLSWEGWAALGRITACYSRAKNWPSLTKVLLECMESAKASEEDLFLCRAAMQIMLSGVNESVQAADDFLQCYAERKALPQTPLMHFTSFLIEALRIPSAQLVNMLSAKYAPALDRDKHLGYLLKKVTAKHFARRSDNLLSNLLDGLLRGSS